MEFQTYVNFEDDGMRASGIRIKKNDKGIKLIFHVLLAGMPYIAKPTLDIIFRRNDGVCVPATATRENDAYTYTIQGNEVTVTGMLYCDLKLIDTDERLSTQTVSLYVVEDTQTDRIVSGSYTVDDVNEIIDNLEHVAEKYDIDKIAKDASDALATAEQAEAEVANKANRSELPTQLSDLASDANHRTVTDAEKAKWDAGGGGGMEVVEVTRAVYESLMPAPLTDGKLYKITDEDNEPIYAEDVLYNNTQTVNDALTWKLLGETTGTTILNLPSNWRELAILIYATNGFAYSYYVTRRQARNVSFMNGFFVNSSTNGSVNLQVKENTINIGNVIENGVNQSTKYKMHVEWR